MSSQVSGMRAFIIVWIGQVISQLGSAMVGFGVSIWLYQQTNQAATLTWAAAAFFAPLVFLSPIAGTIVDRGNRKRLLILTDLVAGMTSIVMLLLLLTNNLEVWQIYTLNFINGAFSSLQFPAFSAAITMLVKKEHYARTSGFMQLGGAMSNIFAPAAAAALLPIIDLRGLLIVDIVTFSFAVLALAVITIPSPPKQSTNEQQPSFWRETAHGFTYIWERPSLLGLQLVFMGINLTSMFGFAILTPMILASTGNNELTLGTAQSIGAAGGVAGGLLLSVWGGPKKKVNGVLGGMLLASLFGTFLMGVANTVVWWSLAGFFNGLILPVINGSNQAIWQAKVAPQIQGRVFGVRRLIAQVMGPIITVVAGPLADNLFEPAMMVGGAWAEQFGWLVGIGPGAGMSLMMVIAGVLSFIIAVLGYSSATVRNAESLLSDHEVAIA